MSSAIARWDLPAVSGNSVQGRRPGRTVNELEQLERAAYDEAHRTGREAGLAAARTETQAQLEQLRTQVARLDAMYQALSRPLQEMDAEVEQQLVSLALAVARQLVRRELRIDPAQVIAVIRETVGL